MLLCNLYYKINYLRPHYLLLMFLSLSFAVYLDASVNVKATVDKNKVTIGDKIRYTIVIEHDAGIQVQFPELGGNLGEFEIKDYKIIGPKTKLYFSPLWFKKKVVTEYRYIITTFTTGEFKIPTSTITYSGDNGENKEIQSGEITVFVESVKPTDRDRDDIRDIKPPVGIPRGWFFYFCLIFIPLLLIGSGLGYLLYRQKKEVSFFGEDKKKPLPPHELAYERLEKLEAMGLIEQGKIKEYYIILSEIVRRYLEDRYKIPVLDRTTNELYRYLRQDTDMDRKHCSLLKEFLEECDLVKFSKYVPEEEIIKDDTSTARKIIDLTKPSI